MATNARTTQVNENPLCERLQKKFENRGVAIAGTKYVKAAKVNPNVAKAVRTADPFEATAEFVPAKANVKKANAYKAATTRKTNNSSFEATATFDRITYKKAYDRAAKIRKKAVDFNAQTRQMPRVNAVSKAKAKRSVGAKLKDFFVGESYEEKKIKSTSISKGVVLSAIVVAFIVFLMIFSIAQINEFKNEISQLEYTKAELLTNIDDLNVSLNTKNDIRHIEGEATERIGMVRSSQVATKYVTVGGGDRVEICNEGTETSEEYGVFGTLLSVAVGNWEHLMEYIH